MDVILVIGQALFGGYFVFCAYNNLAHSAALTAFAASKGVPYAKEAVWGSGVLMFFGGLSIFLGVRPELGAWAIALFLIPVTYKIYPFWKEQGPAREGQKVHFGKNVALLGAALMLAALYS